MAARTGATETGFPRATGGRGEEEAINSGPGKERGDRKWIKWHGESTHVVPTSSSWFLTLCCRYIRCSHWGNWVKVHRASLHHLCNFPRIYNYFNVRSFL